MKKSIEFKLNTSSAHRRLLLKLLDKGKGIYNLGLSECKKRLSRLRADKEYQTLLALRRDLKKSKVSTKQVDQILRDIVTKRYFLTKTDIEKYVRDNAGYLKDNFNSQFVQTLADRAFETIQKVLYGKSKNVRFKGKWDNILASVHAKSTDTGILFDPKTKAITYMGISIPLVLDYRKDDGYHKWYLEQIIDNYTKHGTIDISYIRIVRRVIKGHDVFYAQFVTAVRPIGMTDEKAAEENRAIAEYNADLIQRAREDGTIRKGKRLRWKRSQGYIETNNRIKELHRLVRETRTSAIRELSSIISALSKKVSAEDLSYKSLQKNYGRSVGNFAPSYFMKDILFKAESAGSDNVKIPLTTALSQYCLCGVHKKKKLSERLHECECGCKSQRDVLSAYLGTYYVPNPGEWEGNTARQYHSEDRLLLTASHRVYPSKTASRKSQGIGFALGLDKRPSSGSCGKTREYPSENSGLNLLVCKDLKSLIGELGSLSSRIPCL